MALPHSPVALFSPERRRCYFRRWISTISPGITMHSRSGQLWDEPVPDSTIFVAGGSVGQLANGRFSRPHELGGTANVGATRKAVFRVQQRGPLHDSHCALDRSGAIGRAFSEF